MTSRTAESAARLTKEETFRASSISTCVASTDGTIVAANAAFVAFLGGAPVSTLVELFAPDDRARVASALRSAADGDEGTVIEGSRSDSIDGRTIRVHLRAVDAVLLAQVEEAWIPGNEGHQGRAGEGLDLRSLLEVLPDVYFRVDSEGRILDWHAGAQNDLRVPTDGCIGRRPEDVIPPAMSQLICSAIARARSERGLVVAEQKIDTPDGGNQFEARVILGKSDEVTLILRNMSARHRAEVALRAAQERLLASEKIEAVGRLAGGVAHDFNNLITVILGRLTFLMRSSFMGDSDRDHAREAFEAASHAASLTRQLLAFSRRQIMQRLVFSPNEIIEPLRVVLQALVGEHVKLILRLDPRVSQVESCPTQVEQVVINLVLNARDAMRDGGTLIISTRDASLTEADARNRDGAEVGAHVVLSVSDTGSGMHADVMAHLFEPFFTTKPVGEGTGLGLASVQGIMRQSGGHAVVRSDLGVGSTFELWFPQAKRSAPKLASRAAASRPRSLAGTGQEILLVEDEDGLRRMVADILVSAGYVVYVASNGDEAMGVLEETTDLALLLADVVMPKMGGRALASRVRKLRPNARVLLMSGHDDVQSSRPIDLAQGDFQTLEKPFTEDVLLETIRELLSDSFVFPIDAGA